MEAVAEDEPRNPLLEIVSFPAGIVLSRQEVLPSESMGWGLNLVLALPRRVAFEHVRAQLATAGFEEPPGRSTPALFHFFREDAYVWGMVVDAAGGSRLFLSTSAGQEEPEEA